MSEPASVALARHRAIFLSLVTRAENRLRQRRYDDAAAFAQVAAAYAWHNHSGFFASSRLERVVEDIARAAVPGVPSRRDGRSRDGEWPQRIAHVLTESLEVGGHTRLAWRWIQRDDGRSHSVLLTRPRPTIPEPLDTSVQASGGQVLTLDGGQRAVRRAHQLRQHLAEVDLAILHVHPSDVVANLALAPHYGRPPVILVNHADHVFWLGTQAADVFCHIRASGRAVAEERRGIQPGRSAILPIPLDPPRSSVSRRQARQALGCDDETVVLLTVASAYKYEAIDGLGFLDLVTPAILGNTNVTLLAVGPQADGDWRLAAAKSGGRIRALGQRSQLEPLYRAADVYLDSYPMASLTSFTEAGSWGLPLVSFCTHPGAEVLCSDEPPGRVAVRVGDPVEYRRQVSLLVGDLERRRRLGQLTRAAIDDLHGPAAWAATLAALYGRMSDLQDLAPRTEGRGIGVPGALDDRLCRMNWRPLGLQPALREGFDLLSPPLKLAAWSVLGLDRAARLGFRTDVQRHWLEYRLLRAGGRYDRRSA